MLAMSYCCMSAGARILFMTCVLFQRLPEMPPELAGQKLKLCTGRERLTKYEQEGLVPFVGESCF